MAALAPRQLFLNLRPRDDATLENFLSLPGNSAALEALGSGGEDQVYLHGPADGGKSHLLQALCHAAGPGALYLPGSAVAAYPAEEVLSGAEGLALVCIDELDLLAGREDWEQALFHFYNRARESACRLCVAAARPPGTLPLELPDLRSRLAAGLVFALPAPDDAARRAILSFRAGRRGLRLAPELAGYILARAPRGLADLLAVLERLDQASLAARRPLTQPFVREVMSW
ncbi:DnaA regulatory inactivator Hda [Pseudohaliea rubra]|uniref:DnaA regulatory inactivator Hda n=1 Tax=Pseudohaliea rubra DSM 19751 TaxID=1265313 RepID=A0A095XZS1_9GAMM|nr:DnaA regulatory inactivator Hda [Pseudohaliea rubra]KGE05276.1 DnaA regulatory inactivator Hda [Pseudohaliea rubra DSM 19751]